MSKFLDFIKTKKDLLFWIIAILAALFIICYVIYLTGFLIVKLNVIFDSSLIKPVDVVKFNLEQLEELRGKIGLIKK